jgi:hypothetical protein
MDRCSRPRALPRRLALVPAVALALVQALAEPCAAQPAHTRVEWTERGRAGSPVLESSPVDAGPNRICSVTVPVTVSGAEARIRMTVLQLRRDGGDFEPPEISGDWTTPTHGKHLAMDVYVRPSCDKIRIRIEAENAEALSADRVGVSWNAESKPPTLAPAQSARVALEPVLEKVAAREPAQASVELIDGNLRLLFDCTRVAPAAYANIFAYLSGRNPELGGHSFFADAGVHWQFRGIYSGGFHFHLQPKINPVKLAFWPSQGVYDPSVVDWTIREVLAGDPDAKVMLAVWVDPYMKWGQENPGEICMNEVGEMAIGDNHLVRWGQKLEVPSAPVAAWGGGPGQAAPVGSVPITHRYLPSLYSQKMRDDVNAMLTALVRHVESDPVASRCVVGYALLGFNDLQFNNWAHWDKKRMDDYSPAAESQFREWVRRRYGGDEARLRAAWNQPEITFDAVSIPRPEERRSTALFHDWKTRMHVADFNRFYAEYPVELVESFAKTVKEHSAGRKIVTRYFASPLNAARSGGGWERMAASPFIDAFHCPAHYGQRLPGQPGGAQAAMASALLHGKLFLTEQDFRTPMSGLQWAKSENYRIGTGRAENPEMFSDMVKRETGMLLAAGQGTWWLDMEGPGIYNNPAYMAPIAEAVKAFNAGLEDKGAPEADVAFVIGERSIDFLANTDGQVTTGSDVDFRWYVMRHQRDKWNRSGVPYHVYTQADLLNPKLPDYKVWIFLSPHYLAPAEAAKIESLKSNGRVLVFLHAPGMIGADDPAAAIGKVSGIRVAADGDRRLDRGRWSESGSPAARGCEGVIRYMGMPGEMGSRPILGPAFRVVDEAADLLASYEDGGGAAIAVKSFAGWTSVFCGIPQVESQFLNNLATMAGAWVVSDPYDAVYASQHYLTVHAIAPGKKRLRLRYPSRVVDLSSGETVAENTAAFEIDMPFGHTRWFKLTPAQ